MLVVDGKSNIDQSASTRTGSSCPGKRPAAKIHPKSISLRIATYRTRLKCWRSNRILLDSKYEWFG